MSRNRLAVLAGVALAVMLALLAILGPFQRDEAPASSSPATGQSEAADDPDRTTQAASGSEAPDASDPTGESGDALPEATELSRAGASGEPVSATGEEAPSAQVAGAAAPEAREGVGAPVTASKSDPVASVALSQEESGELGMDAAPELDQSGAEAASVGGRVRASAAPREPAAAVPDEPGPALQEAEDLELQREAKSFVAELSRPSDEPLEMEQLDTFVTGDRPLAQQIEEPRAGGVADAGAGTPVSAAGPADSAGDAPAEPTAPAEAAPAPDAGAGPVEEDHQEVAEAAEGEAPGEAGSLDDGAEAALEQSRVDLPLSEEAPVTIAKLLGARDVVPSNAVFYVHTVQPDDDQGIWGIIHDGIIKNFAEGVAMRRGGEVQTYRIDIPRDADEIETEDNSSSFLGQLIYDKSRRSWVYNYETERVGQSPNRIMPGQEIVIVSFTPQELIAIYKHFVRESGSDG